MNKISKLITGLVLGLALTFSSITPVSAQTGSLSYVHRSVSHITTATTTTITSTNAYITSIVVSTSAVGTAFKVAVQDKAGTARILIPALGTSAVGYQTIFVGGKDNAILMSGGIDLISTGTPGVIDVFITYYTP
jgi:hypothetical protein